MKIEIISIGNEVLAGFTINSNAAFISAALRDAGYTISSHRVVPDDAEPVQKAISEGLDNYDLVLCTGGLGPTCDDRTRTIIADIFDAQLEYNEDVATQLQARYGEQFSTLENQATIPNTAEPFHNTVGTAPGLLFRKGQSTAIFMPGVPVEMREMFSRQVLPYIQKEFPLEKRQYRECLNVCLTKEADVDQILRKVMAEHPDLDCGIYPFQGLVCVHLIAEDSSEEAARQRLRAPLEKMEAALAGKTFKAPSGKIQEAIHQEFLSRGLTLATAESCTGGHIASTLVKLPGASKYLKGGIVAYSNEVKQQVLGVQASTLERHGAVSREMVIEMAEGVREKLQSDYGIATSGVAGPDGGSPEKPVGTVWVAVAGPDKTVAHLIQLKGNRESIIERSTHHCLSRLWQQLPE